MSLSLIGQAMGPFSSPEPHLSSSQQVSLRAFRNAHRFPHGTPDAIVSLRHLQTRHDPGLPLAGTPVRFLWYNTFLMKAVINLNPFGVDYTFELEAARKPELESRASELGIALNSSDFDLIALGEVWHQDELNTILRGMTPPPQVARGPRVAEGSVLGSGLCVLSRRHKIEKAAEHVYQNKGKPLSDADCHARKSVMLTRVAIGDLGALDLYSTHLHSGGDIPDLSPAYDNVPSEAEKQAVRLAQCDELVHFIKATHDPTNVAVVVGDFNIGAFTGGAAPKMQQANLVDLWSEQYGTRKAGPTIGNFYESCPKRVRRNLGLLEPCDEMHDQRTDYVAMDQRIDYIWIEPPQSSHQFTLDAVPMRRMPFARAPERQMPFLSDHIGLSTTFLASRI